MEAQIREEVEARSILTDAAVWTGEAWGALAAVPVLPVHAGSTVVAVGGKVALIYAVHVLYMHAACGRARR